MVWNLEDIPENEDVKIYRYVFKRSKNKEFSFTLTRFLNLYEYLKLHKFKSSKDLRENILSNGKPLFNEKEADEIFEMSVMRGGESKYPFLNNVFRQFLGWIYKWQPEVLQNFTDNIVDIKERLQIFKHVREDYQLGEIYGLVLDFITETIPMNVTILENIANELPVLGPVSGLIATMISAILISFNNILHFTQGDDGAIFVDSFLMIPFIGTSLRTLALTVEKQAGTLSEKRDKLINTIQNSFGEEQAELFAQYIPDLDNLDSYQLPDMNTLQQHGLSVDSLREKASNLAQQHGLSVDLQKRFGAKRLTSSRHHKKKWGTLRKLN